MAAPGKPAMMVKAAARQRCSPANTTQAKAIRFGQAFCTFDVCVACGGGQGVAHLGGAAELRKNDSGEVEKRDLSLEFCSSGEGDDTFV